MSNGIKNGSGKLGLFAPVMQYGFAGFCVVLLGMICWMQQRSDANFDKLLQMQGQTNQVIERNTAAIGELSRVVHDKL